MQRKPTPDDKLKERIEGAIFSSSEFYVGVFDSEEIVGSLQFRTAIPDHPWVKHIGEFGMLILKDYWGQGIGKELLRIMEEFASQIGITRIEAKVRCNNERGIALYQRNGFKIEGMREEGAFIDGKFINEYFIAKLLRSSPKESGLRKILFQDERHSLSIEPGV
jgi:RimJ/RimL family protein N-acetyltransferase